MISAIENTDDLFHARVLECELSSGAKDNHIADQNGYFEGQIKIVKSRSNDIRFNVDLTRVGIVRINTIYYPGWTIRDENGKILSPDYKNDYGVMDIRLDKGKHFVKASFEETNLRLVADIISVLSFGIFFLFLFYFFKFKRS